MALSMDFLGERMELRRVDYQINISWRHRYVFVETPKVACSSLKRLLHRIEYAGQPYEPDPDVHDRGRSPLLRPLQLPSQAFSAAMTGPDWFRFAFVRNPYTRALSAYRDKIQRNRPEKAEILQALGMEPDQLDAEIAFIDFLKAVDAIEPKSLDNHFRPQSQLLFTKFVDFHMIGAFEALEEDASYLQTRLGVKEAFDLEDIGAHGTHATIDAAKVYKRAEIDLVQKIYAQDFKFFGYKWEIIAAEGPPARARWAIGLNGATG